MSEELKLLPCPACDGAANFLAVLGGVTTSIKCTTCGLGIGEVFCIDCDNPRQEMLARAAKLWNALPRALTWTTEPPKVPGWYWALSTRNIIDATAVEVVEVKMVHDELLVTVNGSRTMHGLRAFDLWSDRPVPMPKELAK